MRKKFCGLGCIAPTPEWVKVLAAAVKAGLYDITPPPLYESPYGKDPYEVFVNKRTQGEFVVEHKLSGIRAGKTTRSMRSTRPRRTW